MKELTCDILKVKIFDTRTDMGKCAAAETAVLMRSLLARKEEVNMVFAAAPSQDEFLAALIAEKDVDWSRVNAFHMDEYIGLPNDAPQNFGRFLRDRLFGKLNFKSVNTMDGTATDAQAECDRYAALLAKHKLDITCMGIGENGHIAFNDPHIAYFDDPETVKIVELDEACRRQQVNDGCFPDLAAVPQTAITMTIPALVAATHIACIVPGPRKAAAVRATVLGDIAETCPASILRRHPRAILYCDKDSAKDFL